MTTQRPTLNILSVLRYAGALYQKSFIKLFLVTLIAAAISQLLVLQFPSNALSTQDPSHLNISPTLVILALVASIVMLWCHSILQSLIYAQHNHSAFTVGQALLFTLKKLPMIIINGFIFTILLMLGLMLYILPGILIASVLMLYLPLMLFEQKTGLRAFSTSFIWVRPFFFQVLPITILILILLGIPSILPMLNSYVPHATNVNVERGIEVLLTALLFPLANAITISLYVALKAYQQQSTNREK